MGRPVDLYDVRRVDAALGSTLEKLAAAAASAATAGVHLDSATTDKVWCKCKAMKSRLMLVVMVPLNCSSDQN